jgi:hypothetical protein
MARDPWEYSSQWSRLFYDHQHVRHPLQQYPKTPNWCKHVNNLIDLAFLQPTTLTAQKNKKYIYINKK